VRFVELAVGADDDRLLERLYRGLYVAQFPNPDERETLDNIRRYLQLKGEGWYGKNNYHVIALFDGDDPVGISVSDYLYAGNAGVIEFIATSPGRRRGGLGAALLAATEAALAGDARAGGAGPLACVVAEMNDPYACHSLDDNLDPFLRARIWDGWGYRRLDFPYVQPALSPDQKPVNNLLLMVKPLAPGWRDGLPGETVAAILRGYMRWAMRIDAPERNFEYCRMARHLEAAGVVTLSSLAQYIGIDPDRPLAIREVVRPDDEALAAGLEVYREAFPGGQADLDPSEFRRLLAATAMGDRHRRYHFWTVGAAPDAPVEGMASFFTLGEAGFGGYVALAKSLRHAGRFALLLARMEERMRRDSAVCRGWYIECAPPLDRFFARFGFHAIDISYRQPPLTGAPSYAVEAAPALRLMYKDFGRQFEPPQLSKSEFLASLACIFDAVYGVAEPRRSAFFADMSRQVRDWPADAVRFLPSPAATS